MSLSFFPSCPLTIPVLREMHPLTTSSVQHTCSDQAMQLCVGGKESRERKQRRKADHEARSGHWELRMCKQDAGNNLSRESMGTGMTQCALPHPTPPRCQAAVPYPWLYRHLWSPKECSERAMAYRILSVSVGTYRNMYMGTWGWMKSQNSCHF